MKKRTAKLLAAALALLIASASAVPSLAADAATLDRAVSEAAAYIGKTVEQPEVGSVGGEWAVIGLARSGAAVPDSYFDGYYKTVENYVEKCKGVLHEKKYTEYSRVILGLTAAGFDPRNIAGYDLTAALGDFERTVWQGINGPIWALIALDSADYPIPKNPDAKTQATRDLYIGEILRRQTPDGGWNLTAGTDGKVGANEKGDPDLTGMALQALAKYRDDPAVKAASEKALAFLSGLQNGKGGYTGGGDVNSESVVQVLVALCELGIGVDDPRFVKNGYTLADNIISFQNADGSFRHTSDGQGNNMMSSEQAFYGLVAAQRARDGKNPLYRMSDAVKRGGAAANTPGAAGLAGKNAEVSPVPVISPQKTFTDIQNHASKTAISALAARGILNGSTDTVFDPDAGVTRAQFAAIVTRALGLPEKTGTPFADVQDGQWYAKPVATAYFYKIAAGVSDSSFDPAGTVTRQEAAVMVARAAKLCGLGADPSDEEIRDGLAQFDDYRTVADWARPALAFCFSEGLIDDSALDIEPEKPATRAEIAEMLYRLLDRAELL